MKITAYADMYLNGAQCENACTHCNGCHKWTGTRTDGHTDGQNSLPVCQFPCITCQYDTCTRTDVKRTQTDGYEWKYETIQHEYPELPDNMPVTDENILTIAWISARTAMRTMCKIGRNMSYAQEVRRQDKHAEIILDIMLRMNSIEGHLQTLHHVTKRKVAGIWVPVDEYELVYTHAGQEHDKAYTAIADTMNDYFPIYHEAVSGVLQSVYDEGYENLWDAFPAGCRAVHAYVDSMRSYRERTYHKPHADSDTRQDTDGHEISTYRQTDENGHEEYTDSMLIAVEDTLAVEQYIAEIISHIKSPKRAQYTGECIRMAMDGYSRKEIALQTGNKPHIIYDIFRDVQNIVRRHNIIPVKDSFKF